VPPVEADAWREAFRFLQLLRLRLNAAQAARGESLHNHLDPDSLNELDRRILKEALRQARKLQARLARDYSLRSGGFGA
jgi:CBS domain-containing protein